MGQLEDMAMFARIVEAGSMSRVAEQTGIARSAVSRRLAALEQSLNTQLLVRNTRNSTLTDAGSSFYERAKQILADVQELNSETSGSQTQLDGDLRIAAPVSFGLLHLSGVVNEFAEKYPALSLHLDFNDRQVDLIGEGLDLAIRIADLKDSDYLARKIATIRRVLCASPEYLEAFGSPTAPKDLAAHRNLGYTNAPTSSWLMEDPDGRRIRINPPVTISANNGDYLCAAAREGLGIVVAPTFIAGPDIKRGKLVRVLPKYTITQLGAYVVYPRTRFLSRRARCFIDFLVERFGDHPHWDNFESSS